MKTTYYTITGTMMGKLWLPGVDGTMDFSMDFVRDEKLKTSPWVKHFDTLREAVIDALSTGDFRGGMGLAMGNCYLTVHRAGNTRKTSRNFPLSMFTSILDCVIDDYPEYDEREYYNA